MYFKEFNINQWQQFENININFENRLTVLTGANGSGKTTFALNFAELENLKFINADEIAKQYDPNDIQKYKVKAGKKFFEELELSLTEKNSFVIETTLSGKYLFSV